MDLNTDKKVIVITGASSGIGEATARLFAQRGWTVVLAARSEDRINELAGEIQAANGDALAVPTDVTNWEEVDRLVRTAVDRYGRIDAVVNNAGRGTFGTVATHEMDELEQVFRLNVFAPVAMMRAIAPIMRRQGGGVIVNISSQIETIALPFMGSYAATKSALAFLSDAARAELDHEGITVSRVLPGITRTRFGENSARAGNAGGFHIDPDKGFGSMPSATPEKVAEAVWKAVHSRKRIVYVGLSNQITGELSRRAPGAMNLALTRGLSRYVPREGHPRSRAIRNVAMDIVVAGTGTAAAMVGIALAGRSIRHRITPRKVRNR